MLISLHLWETSQELHDSDFGKREEIHKIKRAKRDRVSKMKKGPVDPTEG